MIHYLVTSRWPKTETETCRQLELKTTKTVLCYDLLISHNLPSSNIFINQRI